MDFSLSEFVAIFEKDYLDTFALVKRSVAELERACLKKNENLFSKTSMKKFSRHDSGTKSHSSSSDGLKNASKMTRECSCCLDINSDGPHAGGSPESMTDTRISIAEPMMKSMSVYYGEDFDPAASKPTKAPLVCEPFSINENGKDSSESPSAKPLGERMPFFVLNIKTLKLTENKSVVALDQDGNAGGHSPILQTKKPDFHDSKAVLSSDSESPVAESASNDRKRKCRPLLRRIKSQKMNARIDLDDNFFEEDFLYNIRGIEKASTNRKQIFQQIMEYVFTGKNFQADAHKNYPRNEVIYYRDVNARVLLRKLKNLIENLNAEGVAMQMKIINEKQFLTTLFERHLKNLGAEAEKIHRVKETISSDENELKTIYDKILKISTQLNFKSKSKEAVKKNSSYFRTLLMKFPADHSGSDDRAPIDAEVGIKFITVRKLVEKATEAVDTFIAEKLKQIMIFTYDHFMKPLTLMLLLTKRYYTPRPFMMTNEEYNLFKAHHSNTQRKRIIELLTFWVDVRQSDFTINSDLLAFLVIFLESIFNFDKEHACRKDFLELHRKVEILIEKTNRKTKKELIHSNTRGRLNTMNLQRSIEIAPGTRRLLRTADCIDVRLTKTCGENITHVNDENDPKRPVRRLKTTPLMSFSSIFCSSSKSDNCNDQNLLMAWDAEEIAKQLTLIDMKVFKKIQINHMMLRRWAKPAYHKECKEIYDVINRFNSLSFWVQYVIINSNDPTQRSVLFNKFIEIATECLKMHNFSSSHSIFTAFLRLKNTKIWKISEQNEENWTLLEEIFKSATFFQDMENILKGLSPPAVPSVPFFTNRFFRLQDNVSFLIKLEGNKKYLKATQLTQLADYSMLIKKFQSEGYDYSKNSEMYEFLKKGYKNKVDINFESDNAEEILRARIIELTTETICC